MRVLLTAAICAVIASTSASAADNRDWQTAAGAVTCHSYFVLSEAQASRNDPRWFSETGCRRQTSGIPLTIVQPPNGLYTVQVRLHSDAPETVWISVFEVMGYATVRGKRQGPMKYHDVFRAETPATFDKLIRAPTEAADFGALLKELSNR